MESWKLFGVNKIIIQPFNKIELLVGFLEYYIKYNKNNKILCFRKSILQNCKFCYSTAIKTTNCPERVCTCYNNKSMNQTARFSTDQPMKYMSNNFWITRVH